MSKGNISKTINKLMALCNVTVSLSDTIERHLESNDTSIIITTFSLYHARHCLEIECVGWFTPVEI
jgi:hypothetical protein